MIMTYSEIVKYGAAKEKRPQRPFNLRLFACKAGYFYLLPGCSGGAIRLASRRHFSCIRGSFPFLFKNMMETLLGSGTPFDARCLFPVDQGAATGAFYLGFAGKKLYFVPALGT
jgi:hypothetical protein